MTKIVDFGNVGRHLGRQFEQGQPILPHQIAAFDALARGQREGKTLEQAGLEFTQLWRSVSPPSSPPSQPVSPTLADRRNQVATAVRLSNLEQPDEVTCQSAVIAMLLGEDATEIPKIRRALQEIGVPGDPQVMAKYLTSKLGDRYELSLSANLAEVEKWLRQGEAIGTHGQHTAAGHVYLLDGVGFDPEVGAPKFSVKDPYGEFDLRNWRFKPGTRFYDGWISALGIYSLSVVIGGVGVCKGAYRDGDVDLAQRGMWVHRVKPGTTALSGIIPTITPQAGRRINAAGREIIKESEGLRLESYLCPSGVWTIGWGSTQWLDGAPVRAGLSCTREQAQTLLERDIERFERAVNRLVKAPTTDNQFSALVSFAYNVGAGAFETSTLLRAHNRGDYAAAQSEFRRWVKGWGGVSAPGLVARRKKEANLYGAQP
jgi:GH24 family phage-related lysozyme (muramidase)